jgi:Ca2+-binding EF-hand superfamily protein
MNRNLYIALIAGTVAMGGVALADEPSQQAAADTTTATFTSLDADKDGKISPSEAAANPKIADKFVTADKNQDGYLDPVEFSALAKS